METLRRISAGGVVFKLVDSRPYVALISVRAGKPWGLPKGQAEQGESLARTAHREVREETGLDGRIIKLIDHVQYFFTGRDEDVVKRYFKIVYFFLMEYVSGDVLDHDDEVVECKWFLLDEAIGLLKFEDEKAILRKADAMIREYRHIS